MIQTQSIVNQTRSKTKERIGKKCEYCGAVFYRITGGAKYCLDHRLPEFRKRKKVKK